MSEQNPSKMKSALNFGAVLGLALMILTLITYIFELYEMKWFQYVNWAVFIAGIVIGTKKYRDEVCSGVISYGSALGYGVLLSLFSSIIVSVVNYIYLGYVDSGFLDFTLEQQEMELFDSGMPAEQIEMTMGYTKKFMSPIMIAFWGVLGSVVMGFIISLITSAFLKKDPQNFEDVQ